LFSPGGLMAGATVGQKIIVQCGSSLVGGTAESTIEMVGNNLSGTGTRDDNVEDIGGMLTDNVVSIGDSGVSLINNVDKISEVIVPTQPTPVGIAWKIVYPKIITWALRDKWWEDINIDIRTDPSYEYEKEVNLI
jgi:hypothetical protein